MLDKAISLLVTGRGTWRDGVYYSYSGKRCSPSAWPTPENREKGRRKSARLRAKWNNDPIARAKIQARGRARVRTPEEKRVARIAARNSYLRKRNDPIAWAAHLKKVRPETRAWKKANREKVRKYANRKFREDGNHRLAALMGGRIRKALKRNRKAARKQVLLGCSIKGLRAHLESLFQPGMSWDNYGHAGWHVDHIRPCASFDLIDPEQQRCCFHFTNLQPLWAKDNFQKNAKWEGA